MNHPGMGVQSIATLRAMVWQAHVLGSVKPEWRLPVQQLMADCERRRPMASYNTGTVSEAACLYLAALTAALQPLLIVEVGTFIGTSSLAMMQCASGRARMFTCDKDNDCGPVHSRISCHGKVGSTAMLKALHRTLRGNDQAVDLFFFDGRIQPEDLPLILDLAHDGTVFAFVDFEGREKGVVNVERLQPWLNPKKGYQLLPPPTHVLDLDAKTTIALLVPGALL